MLPPVLCPYCGGTTRLMSVLSSISILEHYLCNSCSRLSERPKGTDGRAVPLMLSQALSKPAVPPSIAR